MTCDKNIKQFNFITNFFRLSGILNLKALRGGLSAFKKRFKN